MDSGKKPESILVRQRVLGTGESRVLTIEQQANLDAAQRQQQRSVPALKDRSRAAENCARAKVLRKSVVFSYGNFLASLIHTGWWVTITLRDRSQSFRMRRNGKRTLRGKIHRHFRDCKIRYGHADGKIKSWRPASKLNKLYSPFTHKILAEVGLFMELLEAFTGKPLGYIIAEEIGELSGRWHLHLLVSGVGGEIRRKIWWSAAFQIWGRARIEPYDPQKAAAFYAAKYAAKQLGDIHLCGTLRGVSMENAANHGRGIVVGGHDVACSDSMPSDFYHSPVGNYRKPQFARTLPARVWRRSRKQKWLAYEAGR